MQKTPSGGLTQGKKKEREKEKRNKNNHNKKDSINKKCFSYGQNRDNKPCQTIPSSLGLDLSSTTPTILTPAVPVTLIPMGVADPLPESIVGLVLGSSILSFQGISVLSHVVDSGYTEKIKFLVSPPTKAVQINKD